MLPNTLCPQRVPTKTNEHRACHWRPKPSPAPGPAQASILRSFSNWRALWGHSHPPQLGCVTNTAPLTLRPPRTGPLKPGLPLPSLVQRLRPETLPQSHAPQCLTCCHSAQNLSVRVEKGLRRYSSCRPPSPTLAVPLRDGHVPPWQP